MQFTTILLLSSFAALPASAARVSAQDFPTRAQQRTASLAAEALPLSLQAESPGLDALRETIGDARIVMLGEPWHGDGATIRLRAELVEWLHREMDFDVLVFEADFYSLSRGWLALPGDAGVQEFAEANVYPFWSATAAVAPLWEYIEEQRGGERPLAVAGVDIRHVGSIAKQELPRRLDSLIATIPDISADRRHRFGNTLERFLAEENNWTAPDSAQRHFYSVINDAALYLAYTAQESLLAQELENLRSAARYTWSGANRDAGMGDNFRWIANELYPDARIIVWAHNNHVIEDKWMYFAAPDNVVRENLEDRSQASMGRFTYWGHEIRDYAGPDVVSIATLTLGGRFTPDIGPAIYGRKGGLTEVQAVPESPPGTLETALAARNLDVAFLRLDSSTPEKYLVETRALDYTRAPPFLMYWDRGFDGFLFVAETFPLTEERPVALGG